MWQISIGPAEVLILIAVASLLGLSGKRGRRWLLGIVPCFAIAAAATPADPLSMLAVALPLSLALVCGVFLAPMLRPSQADEKYC
jgi:Sec-independent protein secretion pathway component TatC